MPTPSRRLEWIDLFRGLAVLGMIWTHAAHTFLDVSIRQSAWFDELDYYHGLIAPAFFWIAGFVRAHVTRDSPKPAWPAMKRLFMVMMIGYLLHLPWYALITFNLTPAALNEGLKVDVLQCLAVSGMLMLLTEKAGRWRYAVGLILMTAFAALQVPATQWHTGLLPLDQYFNHQQGSLFPLFPWVGFGLAGFVTRAVWNGRPNRAAAILAGTGAAVALAHPLTAWLGSAPSFFLERLGWVVLTAVVVSCATDRACSASGWLRLAGRESLLVYVAHLLMIYMLPMPQRPLSDLIGPTQPVWGVLLIFAALFVLSLLLAFGNERRKTSRRVSA